MRLTMLGNGLQVADGFGLTLETTLASFIGLQLETAADFHVHPLAEAILRSGSPEQARIDRLMSEVPQETWNTIKRGADRRAWFEP